MLGNPLQEGGPAFNDVVVTVFRFVDDQRSEEVLSMGESFLEEFPDQLVHSGDSNEEVLQLFKIKNQKFTIFKGFDNLVAGCLGEEAFLCPCKHVFLENKPGNFLSVVG